MKLIKLQDKFILVSDEEIKEGDWVLDTMFNTIFQPQSGVTEYYKRIKESKLTAKWYKIIAGIPELPEIDFSLLSEEDCKTIRWVDVDELEIRRLINNLIDPDRHKDPLYPLMLEIAYTEGFKTAQSLIANCFSLEDIENTWNKFVKEEPPINNGASSDFLVYLKQSLQQTVWNVEVEMEGCDDCHLNEGYLSSPNCCKNLRPKMTNNVIKITKIL